MLESAVILLIAGVAAGFVAGLVGVGGGIIFAPVLLFYFHAAGVPEPALTPLTLGTSLLCTMLTSTVSAWHHFRKGAVLVRPAIVTGLASIVTVLTMTRFVTTQAWYDQRVFQMVFSAILLIVAVRMIVPARDRAGVAPGSDNIDPSVAGLFGAGAAAGAVSSAVGVGGGVVLVPAYNNVLRIPIHTAVGTSSAAIILISLLGVLTYAWLGRGSDATPYAYGFVDPVRALALALPAALTTRLGVAVAHRFDRRHLRFGFGVFAVIVAARLIVRALAA